MLFGVILRSVKKYESAEVVYRRLLQRDPSEPNTLVNLANVLVDMGRCGEAIDYLRQLDDPDEQARRSLGLAYLYNNQFVESESLFADLYRRQPDSSDYQWHLALALLSLHKYSQAWELYESRKQLPQYGGEKYRDNHWQLESELSDGVTVLVYTEQGFGDNIQFSRFLSRLVTTGASVTLVTRLPLQRLFSTIEGVEVVGQANAQSYDYVVSLLSLPFVLGICTPEEIARISRPFNVPANVDGLSAEKQTKLRVGIVWSGKMAPKDRSIPLSALKFLFEDDRYQVVSLQVDDKAKELSDSHLGRYAEQPAISSFYDSAVVMAGLDLMISIDSAPLHLAGMLGVPAIGLLLYHSDWRWQRLAGEQVWYPEITMIEQQAPKNWSDVEGKLKKLVMKKLEQKEVVKKESEPPLEEIS